eukprot:364600-Chlamydomonas_euryale.AAC.6
MAPPLRIVTATPSDAVMRGTPVCCCGPENMRISCRIALRAFFWRVTVFAWLAVGFGPAHGTSRRMWRLAGRQPLRMRSGCMHLNHAMFTCTCHVHTQPAHADACRQHVSATFGGASVSHARRSSRRRACVLIRRVCVASRRACVLIRRVCGRTQLHAAAGCEAAPALCLKARTIMHACGAFLHACTSRVQCTGAQVHTGGAGRLKPAEWHLPSCLGAWVLCLNSLPECSA